MRLELERLAEELDAWLPSESEEFTTLFFRLLASLPGGELAEEAGYRPLPVGWKEAELLAKTLATLQDASDVAYLVGRLAGGRLVEDAAC